MSGVMALVKEVAPNVKTTKRIEIWSPSLLLAPL